MNTAAKSDSVVLRSVGPVNRLRSTTTQPRVANGPSSPVLLYLAPLKKKTSESILEFHAFNAEYVENLRNGDAATQEHFTAYFTALIHVKLRSRLQSPQAVEDVRQEVFLRVFAMLRRDDSLRRPEALGAFVNSVCNNVLLEHYRSKSRTQSLDEPDQPELPATGVDIVSQLATNQMKDKVREILQEMPLKDRMLLKAVFLDERDRDQVCQEFGVDREYLRVLLFRAKKEFKAEYLKRVGCESYTH